LKPPNWLVYKRKSENEMDAVGYPYFRKPPLVGGFNPSEKY
jgi:hypothetical protein